MAIGLDQLKKKSKVKAQQPKADAESARTQLRPWSQRGLAKEGRSSKERSSDETYLKDDWVSYRDVHESPLFWIDLKSDSQLALLQEKLVDLEQRATKLINKPQKMLRKFRLRFGI